jgi:hypothetical protein
MEEAIVKLKKEEEEAKIYAAQVEKVRKEIERLDNSCKGGQSKSCIHLASIYYDAGYLSDSIKYTNVACTQGNDTGCKLQNNYILEKNGQIADVNASQLVNEQRIANMNQANHNAQMEQLERSRQIQQAIQNFSNSIRTPAQAAPTKCHSSSRYNQFTKGYEVDTNCQ